MWASVRLSLSALAGVHAALFQTFVGCAACLKGAASVLWLQSEACVVQDVPAAHTGFLNRARGVPILSLYQQATRLDKRLVLTGTAPPAYSPASAKIALPHLLCLAAVCQMLWQPAWQVVT